MSPAGFPDFRKTSGFSISNCACSSTRHCKNTIKYHFGKVKLVNRRRKWSHGKNLYKLRKIYNNLNTAWQGNFRFLPEKTELLSARRNRPQASLRKTKSQSLF